LFCDCLGGLPQWRRDGYGLETGPAFHKLPKSVFSAKFNRKMIASIDDVRRAVDNKDAQVRITLFSFLFFFFFFFFFFLFLFSLSFSFSFLFFFFLFLFLFLFSFSFSFLFFSFLFLFLFSFFFFAFFFMTIIIIQKYESITSSQIIDARSANRFEGAEPELRTGVRCGHIPGSVSVPFTYLIDEYTGLLKTPAALKYTFERQGVDLSKKSAQFITLCGSGVTSAFINLGLHMLGFPYSSLYDGSWTEWVKALFSFLFFSFFSFSFFSFSFSFLYICK